MESPDQRRAVVLRAETGEVDLFFRREWLITNPPPAHVKPTPGTPDRIISVSSPGYFRLSWWVRVDGSELEYAASVGESINHEETRIQIFQALDDRLLTRHLDELLQRAMGHFDAIPWEAFTGSLSMRDAEIRRLALNGLTSRQIAARLGIGTEKTVRNRIRVLRREDERMGRTPIPDRRRRRKKP